MDGNLLFGYTLMAIGVVAMAGGIAISVVESLRPSGATSQGLVGDIGTLLEALAKVLSALAKLKGGAQLFVLGLLAFAGGVYLVAVQPL